MQDWREVVTLRSPETRKAPLPVPARSRVYDAKERRRRSVVCGPDPSSSADSCSDTGPASITTARYEVSALDGSSQLGWWLGSLLVPP